MSTENLGRERRKDPRIDNSVPVKIFQEDGDVVTETANISRSGAYCRMERCVAPMTKMKVFLLLPIKKDQKVVTKKISCQGIVVRTEPIKDSDAFNVAIFFNDISQRDAECIAEYVSSHLEKQ